MKREAAACVVLLCVLLGRVGPAVAGSLWGMTGTSVKATRYDGDAAGMAALDAQLTPTGLGQIGPGNEGLTLPPYRPGVMYMWSRYDGYRFIGPPLEAWPNGVRALRADSAGVTITGITEFHNVVTRFFSVINPTGTDMAIYGVDSIGHVPMGVSVANGPGFVRAATFQATTGNLDLLLAGARVKADSARFGLGVFIGGQKLNKILRGSATLDFDLSAVNCQDLTITVAGAAVGDEVFVGAPNGSIVTDETLSAWVSAADTVKIRACDGAGAGNPASGTYKVTVFQ